MKEGFCSREKISLGFLKRAALPPADPTDEGIYMHTIRPLCLNGKLVRELEIFRTIGK